MVNQPVLMTNQPVLMTNQLCALNLIGLKITELKHMALSHIESLWNNVGPIGRLGFGSGQFIVSGARSRLSEESVLRSMCLSKLRMFDAQNVDKHFGCGGRI
jgi:hypothetical protein